MKNQDTLQERRTTAVVTPLPMFEQAEEAERFYQGLCAPYDHEPTRDRIAVITAGEKGEGLITLKPVQAGEVVFRFHGTATESQTLFTLQQAPGRYIEDPLVMGKVLHECAPNMSCDMESLTFTARRAIAAGEYLTMDYESTEDELYRSFFCGCGSAECRGYIRGRQVTQQISQSIEVESIRSARPAAQPMSSLQPVAAGR
jgi:hypothetical protein